MSGLYDVERVDRRLDLAGELLEHEVLVLHLGHEASGLEQTRTVPAVGRLGGRAASDVALALERHQGVVSLVSVALMSSTSRSCS